MRLRAAPLSVAVAMVACGAVDGGASLQAPLNACDQSACTAYKQHGSAPVCDGAACQAKNRIDTLFYVVTLSPNAFSAAGETFVVANDALLANKCLRAAQITSCVRLPPLGEIAGSYVAKNSAAIDVQYSLGGGDRSVPTDATFRPAVPLSQTALADVALLGMDLQPIVAAQTVADQLKFPAPAADGATSVPNVGYDATIPIGSYELTLSPLPPFDAAYPPIVQTLSIAGGGPLNKRDPSVFDNTLLGKEKDPLAKPGAHPVTVTRAGGLKIEGWTLFLRDDRTNRRISTIATLHEPARVNLYTINQSDPKATGPGAVDTIRDDVELVMHPADPLLPDLVIAALGNTVQPVAAYPLVPPAVTVRGAVMGDDGTPVRGQITLESQSLVGLDDAGGAKDLRYLDTLTTAADGSFERTLPPGKYSAIVTPEASSQFAKTIVDLVVDVPSKAGDVVQEGKNLTLARPVLLRGSCVATDGRKVAEAEVEARASASLRYAVNPAERDALRWPRSVRVPTDFAGEFVLPVDPNATYDVIVRPATGTRFPWTIVEGIAAGATIPPISVPAPSIVDVTLHDASDNAVPHALVRAFVTVASPSPGKPPVALEIGRAETDETGRFQLYLDGTRGQN